MIKCSGTHCINPPIPSNDTHVEIDSYLGNPINDTTVYDFETAVTYRCFNGRRFQHQLELPTLEATCKPGNIWIPPPDWSVCLESKS